LGTFSEPFGLGRAAVTHHCSLLIITGSAISAAAAGSSFNANMLQWIRNS